ncbi:MAG: hypothetical protein ACFCGT_19395 [Sandaracinaceae bacterium]
MGRARGGWAGAAGLTLVGLAVCVLAACSHTFYQRALPSAEQLAVEDARARLVEAAGGASAFGRSGQALDAVVDWSGRQAAETLVVGMSLESTRGDALYERLARALALGLLEDGQDPWAVLEPDTVLLASRLALRLAEQGLLREGLGLAAPLLGHLVGLAGRPALHRAAMVLSLRRADLGRCGAVEPIVAYDAAILRHLRAEVADRDPVYVAWRDRVKAIYLVRFPCPTHHVVMLLTRDRGRRDLRVLGWHRLSAAQWTALEPRLREALDLRG